MKGRKSAMAHASPKPLPAKVSGFAKQRMKDPPQVKTHTRQDRKGKR